MTICTCYVKALGEEAFFGVRMGAHSLSCPLWRESLDPVDHLQDCELRAWGEKEARQP
jgi:hypothetical protein